MKNTKFTLEFSTHVLANSVNPVGLYDCFQRDGLNRLVFNQAWWYSSFTKAIEIARIRGIKAADICMDLSVEAPTQPYKRRYGDAKFRTHEAIMPGTKVTFEAVVADHVTESNLKMILEKMGKFVGMSPYGYRLGFGKFRVLECIVASSDASDTVELPPATV